MTKQANTALLVIDVQNDYFSEGNYPLWNTHKVLENTVCAIETANERGFPVILVQHIARGSNGKAPFFNEDSVGVEIHPQILKAAPGATIVEKGFADSFEKTDLESTLEALDVTELLICGMMTQNCVTHTAISKSAEKYKVSILADCCTTVDEMIHNIALNGVSTRVPLVSLDSMV